MEVTLPLEHAVPQILDVQFKAVTWQLFQLGSDICRAGRRQTEQRVVTDVFWDRQQR